jgi:hypothetical protein
MSAHTPGPWFPTQDSRWNEVARIGRVWNIGTARALADMGNPKADADLIASAPDLLSALQTLLDVWDDGRMPTEERIYVSGTFDRVINESRAAIAKATGAAQ